MRFASATTARALTAFLLLAPAARPVPAIAQERARASTQTDETVDVVRGTRFTLESLAGTVTVRAWDREAVRVVARHASGVRVSIHNKKATVSVESDAAGRSGTVDYEISVPRWMPVAVDVTYDDITVEGTESEVSAETVRGNVTIRGGAGTVRAESVEGHVTVEHTRARVNVSSVNDFIRVDGAAGDVNAETTNGAITLTGLQSSSVRATTVNGGVTFDGTIADEGHYALGTHNGDIVVAIPERANVTFDVRTYNGRFTPELALKGTAPSRRGGRGLYTLGNGSAQMELESFGGSIRLQVLRPDARPGRDLEP